MGLLVKQSLFNGALGGDARTNFVDSSTKGRSQFIQQLEEFTSETERKEQEEERAVKPFRKETIPETEKLPVDEIDFQVMIRNSRKHSLKLIRAMRQNNRLRLKNWER